MDRFELSNYYPFNPLEGKKAKFQQIFVFRNNGVIHQIRKDCLFYDFGIALIRSKDKTLMSYITNIRDNLIFSAFYYDHKDEYYFFINDQEKSMEIKNSDLDFVLFYLEKEDRAHFSLMSTTTFDSLGMTQINAGYNEIDSLREEAMQCVYLLEGEGECFKALKKLSSDGSNNLFI